MYDSPLDDLESRIHVPSQGQMRYHVKWKGYEKKTDRTWETEENLEYTFSSVDLAIFTLLTVQRRARNP